MHGLRWIFSMLLACATPMAWSHGGGLDNAGCHHDRKAGDYHCHRGSSAMKPAPVGSGQARQPAPASASPLLQSGRSNAFANCTQARAAGAAPVRRGEPGYGPHLDRDNDGIGCEPYRGR